MLEMCRQVITRAAQDTWHQAAAQNGHVGAAHHVTDGTSWEQVNCLLFPLFAVETVYARTCHLPKFGSFLNCFMCGIIHRTNVPNKSSCCVCDCDSHACML